MPVTLLRPYCTLADVQQETANNESTREDTLKQAINDASRFVDQHCRCDFWKHDHTASPLSIPNDWVAGDQIFFPWPIVSLTKLEDITSEDNPIELDTDTWHAETGINSVTGAAEKRGLVTSSSRFTIYKHQVSLRATGVFGYALAAGNPTDAPPTNLPTAVKRATMLIAAAYSGVWKKRWRDPNGDQQETLVTNVPKEAFNLLSRWRIPIV